MQPWITKVTQDFVIEDILKGIKGLIRCGVNFKPSTPPSPLLRGDFETQRQVHHKIWSSHHCCETWKTFMKLLKDFFNIQKWLARLS
jgi:hypothetical protein